MVIKKKILKQQEKMKIVAYKGNPLTPAGDFSGENFQARRQLHNIFQELNGRNLWPILYPAKLLFGID